MEIRHALRTLKRSPGYTAVAILSLALGIGLNTALFNVVHTLALSPLPVAEPERLVSIFHRHDRGFLSSSSYPDYAFYREHGGAFEGVAAFLRAPLFLGADGPPERVVGELVSPEYFQLLGVGAALGRTFQAPGDAPGLPAPGEAAEVVLGHGSWMRRFGGDPGVIGRTVSVGGHPFTVIGVAPAGFRGLLLDQGAPPELWIPAARYREAVPPMAGFPLLDHWGAHNFHLVGRLREGISFQQAQAAMEVVGAQAAAAREAASGEPNEFRTTLYPTREARIWPEHRERLHRFLALLGSVAGIVLLLACFNVANLMVARAVRRQREMAVRLSLGAGRGRLARQLLAESLLLSLAGGGAGLLVARGAASYLARFPAPFGVPLPADPGLGAGVLGFALLASLATAFLVGLLPLHQACRVELASVLGGDPSGRLSRVAGLPLRDALVVAQVSLSLLLLVGGGLFARTLHHARAESLVAEPEKVLLASLDLQGAGYDPAGAKEVYGRLLERAASLPGVRSASLVQIVPMGGRRGARDIVVETPHAPAEERTLNMEVNVISPDYFRTVGLPLVRGRPFTPLDREGSPPVAIVNERMAEQLWPGEDPVGRTFRLRGSGEGPVQVVGVVRDGKYRNFRAPLLPGFYLPFAQSPGQGMSLQIRAEVDPMALAPALRAELRALDPALPRPEIMTMKAYQDRNLSQERLMAQMLGAFGSLALILALLGIYGVMAYTVGERTREIGVRMALGAQGKAVVAMVLKRGVVLALAGLAMGGAAALLLTRFLAALLYGVEATDPSTFGGVGLGLLAAALLSSWLPARRAAGVDPALALRGE